MKDQDLMSKEFFERFSQFNSFILLTMAIEEELNHNAAKKVRAIFKRQNPWSDFFYQTPIKDINLENYRKHMEGGDS